MKTNHNKIFDIFMSYRQNSCVETARLIYNRLTNLGYRVSFDMETLHNGKFNTQLYERIGYGNLQNIGWKNCRTCQLNPRTSEHHLPFLQFTITLHHKDE